MQEQFDREGWALMMDADRPAYVYQNGAAWVRKFCATGVRPEHWQAYRMTAKRMDGRKPWGHPNARIGSEGVGYPTLVQAMDAVEKITQING